MHDWAYRLLGASVLQRALQDAQHGDPRAAQWLTTPGAWLSFWCGVAGLDDGRVRAAAGAALRQRIRPAATVSSEEG
ncbi:MAG: hypothetical protein IT177_22540 [Acidobacteria bacterium]|nr:hypothetical protein [Acidobacteriota bacterium]